MKIGISRYIIDLQRNLNNPSSLLKALTVWAAVAIFAGGIFGIYPQSQTLITNIGLYPKIKEVNVDLEKKVSDINSEYLKVEKNPVTVNLLDTYLPDDYGIQNYIVDLSFAAAKQEFQLVTLSSHEDYNFGKGLYVQAVFKGTGSIENLVNAVESLKRIAQVGEVKFVQEVGEKKVFMDINVYVMEDK